MSFIDISVDREILFSLLSSTHFHRHLFLLFPPPPADLFHGMGPTYYDRYGGSIFLRERVGSGGGGMARDKIKWPTSEVSRFCITSWDQYKEMINNTGANKSDNKFLFAFLLLLRITF